MDANGWVEVNIKVERGTMNTGGASKLFYHAAESGKTNELTD